MKGNIHKKITFEDSTEKKIYKELLQRLETRGNN